MDNTHGRQWLTAGSCLAGLLLGMALTARAQHQLAQPKAGISYVAPASDEAELAIKRIQPASGLKVDLWAAEPMLANPVAFCFDEKGRVYVCETFRLGAGVDDIRGIMDWLNEDLASRSVDDRLAEMKRHLGDRFETYSNHSERISLLEDRSGKGKADHATVFANGFNSPLDGIGAGVLARKGDVWFTDIPNLWLLRDTKREGAADSRKSLHYGFGVRVGFSGHDLHGLVFGPDGKLYFSIGDRGSNIKVADGRMVGEPDSGCVFRCNPDGSDLEVFAYGLRNPQDLVFDDHGNLFTGDNNSDSGDQARWVYLVEGSDNGWRVGYQFMENPYSRGPFNAERLWYPPFEGQPAYIVPPVANISSGPSGVAYFPGTGLPPKYRDHFFLVDFRGGSADSGVHTFALQPKGAGFELVGREHFVWSILATDVKFGVDGGLYVSDWVEGWEPRGKGRLYRVHDPAVDRDPLVLETKRLLAEGMEKRSLSELGRLLENPDLRVRQEAQFELADRGPKGAPTLASAARQSANPLARLHGIWGLGQVSSPYPEAGLPKPVAAGMDLLVQLVSDPDAEVRSQAVKVLGDRRYSKAYAPLKALLTDPSPRVQFFAAISLGKFGRAEVIPALFDLLRRNADKDPYLRHAGVMGLVKIGDVDALLASANDESPAVRMGVLLALRRLERPEIAVFLKDKDPALVLEAARAINDEPIPGALRDLAALIDSQSLSRWLAGEPLVPPSVPSDAVRGLGLEALLRRVLNANFHHGTSSTARALARFAARPEPPENMRVEALSELADWEHPAGIDRVVGLWRPVAAVRPAGAAAEAVQAELGNITRQAPDSVRIAALDCVARLHMTGASSLLSDILANAKLATEVRSKALSVIAALDLPTLEEALDLARKDPDEDLRRIGARLEGRLSSPKSAARVSAILANGSVGEKQAALAALSTIPGSSADDLVGQWLDKLQSGALPKELRLDVVEAAAKRNSEVIKRKLDQYESSFAKDDPLSPYEDALYGGSAPEGKKIFSELPAAQCVRCHRINGQGGDVGPDLSHVAAQKDRHYFLESILLPNRQIAPGFESVMLVMKDGDSHAGVLKSETADEVVINSSETGVLTVKKADIQSRRTALSPMPEGLGKVLSKENLRDLVEFLSSLK